MSRTMLGITFAASLLATANTTLAGGMDVRVGGFFPRGQETLFSDLNDLFTPNADQENGVEPRDFDGAFGGIEYNTVVAPNLELGVSIDGYGRTLDTSYRDYTRPDDSEIWQELELAIVPFGATLRAIPTSKRARLAPFVGVGLDVVFYSYEARGDFIDFFDDELPIYADAFRAEGAALGAHIVAGLRVYINRDFAIVGEGRYQWAQARMGDDFAPSEYDIDLSGASFSVGLHVRF